MAGVASDVVVIGAGIAGLTAANRAAELGRTVVVLEKGREHQYLCNSRYAYGTFHINFTDLNAPEETLYARIMACSAGTARPDLARAVARDGRRLMQWLRAEGVELVNLGGYGTNVLAPAWRKGYGLTWQGYGADLALQRLGANLEQRQGRILRGVRARAIRRASDGFEIAAEESGRTATFRAASVVIADGGFQANLDMLRRHGVSPAPERLLARHGGTAVGDGLAMALELGAAISPEGMNNFYGHLHNRDAMHSTSHWPRPVVDELAATGIVIDASGRRITDEGLGGIWIANAIARLADPLSTAIVFDQAIWEGPPGTGHVQPPNPLTIEAGGTLHRAETIAALAEAVGVPPATLQATVDDYNAALAAGTPARLSPSRRTDAHKAWPIVTPPFYAMPICAAITNCMGGIEVDGDGRVLDRGGAAIAGLYAAGSTIGGLDGGPHAGYVGGLIKATIGLRAAERIASSGT